MLYPINHWPVCHGIPSLLACTWETAKANVRLFAVKLHNIQVYNLLQASHAILKGTDHEIKSVCTEDEYGLLRAYAYACILKKGMDVLVTWKSDVEGEPDSTHACKVDSECTEGRKITVLCDGARYDVCLYLDEISVDHKMLLAQFEKDFQKEDIETVYMVDSKSKAFYYGFFNAEGKIHGDCKVLSFEGTVYSCKYDNGMLLPE